MALVVAVALLMSATSAYAVPASKTEQARAVKKEIEQLDMQVERAAEQYNEASAKHAKLLKDKQGIEAKLKKIDARSNTVKGHLNARANSMYRTGQAGFIEVLFGAESFEEFAATWDVLTDLNASDADALGELRDLQIEATTAHKDLAVKEAEAKKQVTVMATKKAGIENQLAERKRKLSGIEGEIAQLEAAEERARAARAVTFVSSSASKSEKKFPAPTRAPRSEVVNIAKQYLGAPYRWAAAGPNAFDCSGFTMYVYRQVGVSLPHSSRAQINVGQRVSRANLQPGDLVFFGSPIHHVGIYVGGGQYIHAPRTGDVVKISSLGRGDYSGASRP